MLLARRSRKCSPRTVAAAARAALVLAGPIVFAACSGLSRREQLDAVAKDWCESIRASQVVPVYPLTQDVQPGDVFLVQVPIQQQQRLYEAKGFLPLDQHVARLALSGYRAFYAQSFVDPAQPITLPRDWMQPVAGSRAWERAPRAAFPSYGFTVQSGTGLSLAVPVKGVPVGLSLLGTDSATGSIAIADARTFGADVESVWSDLRVWALRHPEFLAGFEPRDGRTNYLRVVTRVYLTGRIDVQLTAAGSAGAGLDVGAPKPIELLNAAPPSDNNTQAPTMARYKANLEALNAMLRDASAANAAGTGTPSLLPGGSVRVTAAAGRTIALQDTFDPPLVLGYLGFDCAILAGGGLGPPVATNVVLDATMSRDVRAAAEPFVQTQLAVIDNAVYKLLRDRRRDAALDATTREIVDAAVRACDQLARTVDSGAEYCEQVTREPLVLAWKKPDNDAYQPPGERTYLDFLVWRSGLIGTERVLADALARERFEVREGTADQTVARGDERHQALAARLEVCRAQLAEVQPAAAAAARGASRALQALLSTPSR
jgi:hypothetical protein